AVAATASQPLARPLLSRAKNRGPVTRIVNRPARGKAVPGPVQRCATVNMQIQFLRCQFNRDGISADIDSPVPGDGKHGCVVAPRAEINRNRGYWECSAMIPRSHMIARVVIQFPRQKLTSGVGVQFELWGRRWIMRDDFPIASRCCLRQSAR